MSEGEYVDIGLVSGVEDDDRYECLYGQNNIKKYEVKKMEIIETKNELKTNLVILIYGLAGVGKTTFGARAPKPLLLDFENGGKYLGSRGIEIDRINITKWLSTDDKVELKKIINNYETIIIDPLGEAMEMLIQSDELNDRKNRQADGSLTISGWGKAKDIMKNFIKWLRGTGKNIIIIAHVHEEGDENRIIKRPKVATRISEDIVGMVDVCGYMYVDKGQRFVYVGSSDDRTVSKDRTELLPERMPPDFNEFIKKINPRLSEATDEQLYGDEGIDKLLKDDKPLPSPLGVTNE